MTQTTQEAQNKAIFHRWFNDVWNGGKYEVAQEVIAPTMLVHGAGGQPVEMGPDGLVGLVSTWRNAFPDGQMYIDGLVAQGDLVAALLTWRGTHEADFYGIAPTGKQVVCVSIGIDRMANNQVVAGWGELDMVGMMQQMGGLPMVGFGASAHGGSPEWGESSAPVEPTGPPSEENRSLMLRYVQARNDRDLDAMCEMIDDSSYVEHNPVLGATDMESSMSAAKRLFDAMPDLRVEVDPGIVIAEGDFVAVHLIVTGTHTGADFAGVSASGAKATWTATDVVRFANGKIVERWFCPDTLTLFQQLGVFGSPPA